jgi:hypothetical protein
MVAADDGRNRMRDLVRDDINQSTFGTGDSNATRGDTDLDSEVTATQNTPTVTTGNLTLSITGIMLSTVGNGNTYNESAVKMNNANDLLLRSVFPDFVKNNSKELHVTDVYTWD